MENNDYKYIIIGGGLAGASAAEGIREIDAEGSILIIGDEAFLPYNRPPLTKGLWSGKKNVQDIFVKKEDFFTRQNIALRHSTRAVSVSADAKTVTDSTGTEFHFVKLLLATGGAPNRLRIPGGDDDGILYYRYLDDFLLLNPLVKDGKSVLVIGGGFIGTEIAAALAPKGMAVTMLFPEMRPCFRVFPAPLGDSILKMYRDRGITVLAGDVPKAIERKGDRFTAYTEKGKILESDLCIAGVGISPSVELAKIAGLAVADGIAVNSLLQTSHPDIYAAGDNAQFPEHLLGVTRRVEHWDNALNQGKHAGRNMAGAKEPYAYLSYFFSDLFELGYEAVGEIDSRLETRQDWQKENEKGVVYYLKDGRIRGVLLCNVWGKVDAARTSIKNNEPVLRETLQEAV
ncbi:MAG TPA: FAD-dependent oxidoreductase [Chitinivibrionales bacterium]|nr:FAD-dependent oxidoreductase [Chitinivibrionales bacterium]